MIETIALVLWCSVVVPAIIEVGRNSTGHAKNNFFFQKTVSNQSVFQKNTVLQGSAPIRLESS